MKEGFRTAPFALLLVLASCGRPSEVVVDYDGGRTRVVALAPNIMRVTSVPAGEEFSSAPSLCVVHASSREKCRTVRTADEVVFCNGKLTATISRTTGEVSITESDGKVLTKEIGRSFKEIDVDGVKAYTVQQSFESAGDEGFFGLGQHQAGEWNYKGRNEELYQYNTKISVPFVVSTRGYGLLWDSYSFCRWGDSRPYASLPEVFELSDKFGVPGALTGTYTAADGSVMVRREASLDQEFLHTPQCDYVLNSPRDFKFAGSSVLFEGTLTPRESGQYDFYLYYAGYTRVFLGGREVVPQIWRTAWNPNGYKFSCEMEAGAALSLRVEWQPDGDVSYNALKVLSPVPERQRQNLSWWGEMQDQIDYYVIASEDIDGVIGGYRMLTGKAPIPPKWAMGYWQSRERYASSKDLLTALGGFRSRGIPVDNIVLDWQYWTPEEWGSHEFDPARFPDPKAMVDSIHALNARFMISVWPKFYESTEHFKEFDSHGWMYRVSVDSNVVDWLGHRQSFYDAYSPGARELFWTQMKDHLLPLGVDAWWMDASEPNIHDCTDMDFRKAMCGPTALGPSTKYFNAYSLMNAQAIFEGERRADPSRRVFLLTRNGFAGLQRYSTASWSGDIGTTWEDMATQIPAALNYSLSGIPMWGQDVGGFSVQNKFMAAAALYQRTGRVTPDLEEWRELQLRWHQWGAFTPLYRSHGQWPWREPWEIAPEGSAVYEGIVNSIRLRYSLMPYVYSCAARIWFDDYTLMRPLVMDFAGDAKACGISDQFLLGPSIMVCPVCSYKARSREVYLPCGCAWYSYDGQRRFEGGRSMTAPAPLDAIPLYVREGSILVCADGMQSTAERPSELKIRIFPGADADFTLYDDDGVSFGYEKGEFCTVALHWDDAQRTLTIGGREGSFDSMVSRYDFTVSLCGSDECKNIEYDGNEQKVVF